LTIFLPKGVDFWYNIYYFLEKKSLKNQEL